MGPSLCQTELYRREWARLDLNQATFPLSGDCSDRLSYRPVRNKKMELLMTLRSGEGGARTHTGTLIPRPFSGRLPVGQRSAYLPRTEEHGISIAPYGIHRSARPQGRRCFCVRGESGIRTRGAPLPGTRRLSRTVP